MGSRASGASCASGASRAQVLRCEGVSPARAEGIGDHGDGWWIRAAVDAYDIEAAGLFRAAEPREVVSRHPHDPLLFLQRHGLLGIAKIATVARLHFDEHEVFAVARNDVQFAVRGAVTPCDNGISAALQLFAREGFTFQP